VTLALNGTAGRILKIEFQNTSGVKKVFSVVLSATHQNFTFDLTGFTSPMASINFVSDQVGATTYTVETSGLTYVIPVTGAAYNAGLITPLPLSPVVAGSHGTAPAGRITRR